MILTPRKAWRGATVRRQTEFARRAFAREAIRRLPRSRLQGGSNLQECISGSNRPAMRRGSVPETYRLLMNLQAAWSGMRNIEDFRRTGQATVVPTGYTFFLGTEGISQHPIRSTHHADRVDTVNPLMLS